VIPLLAKFKFIAKWNSKIATRISNYSLSNAIIFALARFYIIRRMVRVGRWIRSRLVPSTCTLKPLTNVIAGPPLVNIVENLCATGWCPGFALNDNVVEELLNYMKNQKYTCSLIPKKITFMLNECERVEKEHDIPICFAQLLATNDSKLIKSIYKDKALYSIATRYFGYPPTKADVKFSVSFATNNQRAEQLSLHQKNKIHYHFDVDEFIHSLSFFFYLTQSDEESGAHVLVPGTHKSKKLSQLFRTLNFSDDEIEESFPNSQPIIVRGNPGEGFVEDSYIMHKALTPKSTGRYLMQVRYM